MCRLSLLSSCTLSKQLFTLVKDPHKPNAGESCKRKEMQRSDEKERVIEQRDLARVRSAGAAESYCSSGCKSLGVRAAVRHYAKPAYRRLLMRQSR